MNDARESALTEYVGFLKALANPTRAQIVDFLLAGERCVCEMTGPLDVSQPLVSHHLALLRDAGLVRMRSEGTRTYYSIDRERFDADLGGLVNVVERRRCATDPPDAREAAHAPCMTAASACSSKRRTGSDEA